MTLLKKRMLILAVVVWYVYGLDRSAEAAANLFGIMAGAGITLPHSGHALQNDDKIYKQYMKSVTEYLDKYMAD